MNGVCATTRLIGCYHLGPEVIPTPSTDHIDLRPGDEYIVIGTDSLWKHVSHEMAVHTVSRAQTPSSAARKLRDLAVGYGCKNDVSVIVVQLNIGDRGAESEESPVHSRVAVSEPESDLNLNEDVEFTNIDDIISEGEDDVEPRHQPSWNRAKKNEPCHVNGDIDRMILNAVSSPLTSPVATEMKSTNIDDILSSPSPHQNPRAQPTPHYPHHSHTVTVEVHNGSQTGGAEKVGGAGRKMAIVPAHSPPTILGYPAQTIPRDAAGSRTKGGDVSPPLPPSQAINYDQFIDSFQMTQSAPIIPADQKTPGGVGRGGDMGGTVVGKGVADKVGFGGSLRREREERGGGVGVRAKRDAYERGLRGKLTRREVRGGGGGGGGNMEGYLVELNKVMTDLDSDPALDGEPQSGGPRIQRRLSYVEHSYKQLTNNVYSSDVVQVEPEDHHNW